MCCGAADAVPAVETRRRESGKKRSNGAAAAGMLATMYSKRAAVCVN